MVCYIWLSSDVTNNNLYLARFIQISAMSNKSDNQFHAILQQSKPVSHFMFHRTGVTMDSANAVGYTLRDAICALDAYIGSQVENNHEPVRIVCHGGWNHLFFIFALAVERVFGNDYLKDLVHVIRANYIDFAKVLSATGCKKTSLSIVCQHAAIVIEHPVNALSNVRAMKKLCMVYYNVLEAWVDRTTIEDLMHHAWGKLPLSIANVAVLAKHKTHLELTDILYNHCSQKSALKFDHVHAIVKAYLKQAESSQVDKSLWTTQPTLELTQLMESPYS